MLDGFYGGLILLVLGCMCVFGFLQKRLELEKRPNSIVLKIPRAFSLVFGGSVLFFCIACLLLWWRLGELFLEGDKFCRFLALLVFVIYVWCEWYALSWRLECCETEDFFDCRNFFFKKQRLKYSEFSCYHLSKLDILVLKNETHRVLVEPAALHYKTFVDILKRNHIFLEVR